MKQEADKPPEKKDNSPRCPKCGSKPKSVVVCLFGTVDITFDDNGNAVYVEYGGSTEVDWDSREFVLVDSRVLLQCSGCYNRFTGPANFEVADGPEDAEVNDAEM